MRVKLLFFASYQDTAGASEITAELGDESTVADASAWLVERYPGFAQSLPKGRVAVDLEFVPETFRLRDGSEIAFMPPMSGG